MELRSRNVFRILLNLACPIFCVLINKKLLGVQINFRVFYTKKKKHTKFKRKIKDGLFKIISIVCYSFERHFTEKKLLRKLIEVILYFFYFDVFRVEYVMNRMDQPIV